MKFPRAVTAIHQVEITSRCNLRCAYCPSRDITAGKYPNRAAVDMTRTTFERALAWVLFYARQGKQHELNLAGIGESTLHPEFIDFVGLARAALPTGRLIFATNGLIHDEAMVKAIAPYAPEVWVSLHRPERAGPAIEVYKKYGLLHGISAHPATQANTWAGQVTWFDSSLPSPCPWLRDGWVMVMADGRITTCCIDAQGLGVVGHVDDPLGAISLQPYALCKNCYQTIDPAFAWDQRRGVPV